MGQRALILTPQVAMAAITVAAALIARLPLPSLFSIALLAFQIMVQLVGAALFRHLHQVRQPAGRHRRHARRIAVVGVLQFLWPIGIPGPMG